jgi:acetolactate synthase small subunit
MCFTSLRGTRQHHPTGVERVTFIIKAENQADVLARVVEHFRDLNLEIEAIYMVRRRGSETMRINVTIEANLKVGDRVEANLCELANVRSVEVERAGEKISGEMLRKKSSDHYQR